MIEGVIGQERGNKRREIKGSEESEGRECGGIDGKCGAISGGRVREVNRNKRR